jgi:hypothetical protein
MERKKTYFTTYLELGHCVLDDHFTIQHVMGCWALIYLACVS